MWHYLEWKEYFLLCTAVRSSSLLFVSGTINFFQLLMVKIGSKLGRQEDTTITSVPIVNQLLPQHSLENQYFPVYIGLYLLFSCSIGKQQLSHSYRQVCEFCSIPVLIAEGQLNCGQQIHQVSPHFAKVLSTCSACSCPTTYSALILNYTPK